MLFLISSCNLSSPSFTSDRTEERMLNFPPDRSLGKLYILEENPHFTSGDGELEKGEARGSVRITIPEGWLLELRLSPEGSNDLSPLATLNPNDLQAISFYQTQITDEGLVHLKQLSRLKILDLSNTQITGTGFVHLKFSVKIFMSNVMKKKF